MTFDSAANLYVANRNNNAVAKFDSAVNYCTAIGSATNLNWPYSVAVDSAGSVYVSNCNGSTIAKYSSAGVFQFSWSTGTATPMSLAFSPVPVPEPSTWALGAIASGVTAWVARRRKMEHKG